MVVNENDPSYFFSLFYLLHARRTTMMMMMMHNYDDEKKQKKKHKKKKKERGGGGARVLVRFLLGVAAGCGCRRPPSSAGWSPLLLHSSFSLLRLLLLYAARRLPTSGLRW